MLINVKGFPERLSMDLHKLLFQISANFFIFSHGFQKHVTTIHPDGISSPSLYVCFEDSSCWEFVPGLAGNSEKSNCRYWILKTSFRHHNRICSRMLTKPDKGNKGEQWGGKMGVWLDQEESGWVAQGDTSFLSIASASRMVVHHKHVWRDMYLWLFIKQFSVRTALGLLL